MISVAVPSASQRVTQWFTELAKSISFAAAEAPSAKAELMNATGRKETNENVATSRAVVKRLVVVDQRFVNDAPVNPATSVPMAIKLASNIGQPAKTYELKVPAKTAGQIRFPCKRMTAKAKPLGGQTSVVTAFGENDRATWTSPKKSAAIVKNPMTESAALLMLPIA
jgi:hypothetical protein